MRTAGFHGIAIAPLEDERRGQRDGIGRVVHALVEQQHPARAQPGTCDQRKQEEQRDRRDGDRAALTFSRSHEARRRARWTCASRGSGSRSPLGTVELQHA